ncbi:sulfotransferase 1 family member D1-like [Arapaima gigas]
MGDRKPAEAAKTPVSFGRLRDPNTFSSPSSNISPGMEQLTYEEAIVRASAAVCRFPLRSIAGVPLMEPIAQNWESISTFCPNPSDILIATYPKAVAEKRP